MKRINKLEEELKKEKANEQNIQQELKDAQDKDWKQGIRVNKLERELRKEKTDHQNTKQQLKGA